ncbi:hypothetical protein MHH74_29530 [Bacillus sp. FSL M7-0996]|uniref:hypothetical protein n=1 Tax=Bacillus sp. FSL M7-0996 TaxID=2921538 RepID=UPI0030F72C3C
MGNIGLGLSVQENSFKHYEGNHYGVVVSHRDKTSKVIVTLGSKCEAYNVNYGLLADELEYWPSGLLSARDRLLYKYVQERIE